MRSEGVIQEIPLNSVVEVACEFTMMGCKHATALEVHSSAVHMTAQVQSVSVHSAVHMYAQCSVERGMLRASAIRAFRNALWCTAKLGMTL